MANESIHMSTDQNLDYQMVASIVEGLKKEQKSLTPLNARLKMHTEIRMLTFWRWVVQPIVRAYSVWFKWVFTEQSFLSAWLRFSTFSSFVGRQRALESAPQSHPFSSQHPSLRDFQWLFLRIASSTSQVRKVETSWKVRGCLPSVCDSDLWFDFYFSFTFFSTS